MYVFSLYGKSAYISGNVKINLQQLVVNFLFIFLKPKINTKLIEMTGIHKQEK